MNIYLIFGIIIFILLEIITIIRRRNLVGDWIDNFGDFCLANFINFGATIVAVFILNFIILDIIPNYKFFGMAVLVIGGIFGVKYLLYKLFMRRKL